MTTVDTLVQLLAAKAPDTLAPLLPPAGSWSEERRYMDAHDGKMHLVVERSIGLVYRLRVTTVDNGYGWRLEIETATCRRQVQRAGFKSLTSALSDAYTSCGVPNG
jgi:hypothetical protein